MSSNKPINLSENRQGSILAATIVAYMLAVTAVVLRFWSRRLKKAGFWIDDWVILAALFSGSVLFAQICLCVSKGFGRHVVTLGSPNAAFYFLICSFVGDILYALVIVMVKYSILALYMRLFGHTRIKVLIWIIAAIVTSWGLATILVKIFTCIPVEGYWDESADAKCIDTQRYLYAISLPNILTDVILLALPIPLVFKMQAPWSQKRLVIGTFLLGGFVCIASIMRFISVIVANVSASADVTWVWVDMVMWTVMETNFAIVSACLPVLKPIYSKIFKSNQSIPKPTLAERHHRTIGAGPSKQRFQKEWPGMPTLGTADNTLPDQTSPVADDIGQMLSKYRNASSESTAVKVTEQRGL